MSNQSGIVDIPEGHGHVRFLIAEHRANERNHGGGRVNVSEISTKATEDSFPCDTTDIRDMNESVHVESFVQAHNRFNDKRNRAPSGGVPGKRDWCQSQRPRLSGSSEVDKKIGELAELLRRGATTVVGLQCLRSSPPTTKRTLTPLEVMLLSVHNSCSSFSFSPCTSIPTLMFKSENAPPPLILLDGVLSPNGEAATGNAEEDYRGFRHDRVG